MNIDLSGKTALVTGSTAGIGYAIARGLADCGATVVVNGRGQDKVDAAVKKLEGPGGKVRGIAADVSTAEGCKAVVAALPEVDILINNTGIFEPIDFFDIPDEGVTIRHKLAVLRDHCEAVGRDSTTIARLTVDIDQGNGLGPRPSIVETCCGTGRGPRRRRNRRTVRGHERTPRIVSLSDIAGERQKPRSAGLSFHAPKRTRTSTGESPHKALNLARLPIPPPARDRR